MFRKGVYFSIQKLQQLIILVATIRYILAINKLFYKFFNFRVF